MNTLIFIWNITIAIIYLIVMILAMYYLLGSFIAAYQAKWVPYVPSYNEDLARMKKELSLEDWKTMIDLWCWDWKALRFFVKNFWIKKAVWYDFNQPAIIFWRFINWMGNIDNIELKRWDFTKVDISKYDYIYIYLLTEYMAVIEDFVFENMNENATIIANTFKFTKHAPFKVTKNDKWRDRILLYKKGSKN